MSFINISVFFVVYYTNRTKYSSTPTLQPCVTNMLQYKTSENWKTHTGRYVFLIATGGCFVTLLVNRL